MIGLKANLTKHTPLLHSHSSWSVIFVSTNNSAMEQKLVISLAVLFIHSLQHVASFKNSTNLDCPSTITYQNSLKCMVKARDILTMKRQVFVVYLDGFDLHSGVCLPSMPAY